MINVFEPIDPMVLISDNSSFNNGIALIVSLVYWLGIGLPQVSTQCS